MQIALPARITFPSYRSAAAWKVTDTVAFHAGRRTAELADDPNGLIILLNLHLNFADILVIGSNCVACHLRPGGGDVAHAIGYCY
jgi:hypothetical protein